MTEKEEKKLKLSLRASRDILEREKPKEVVSTPVERVKLRGLDTNEATAPVPKERLRFSAIGQIVREDSSKENGSKDNGIVEESTVFQKQVTRELKEDWKESQAFYHEAVNLAQEVFEEVKEGQPFEVERVKKLVERLIDELILGNQSLVHLSTGPDEGYNQLACNAVHVAIISIKIGLSLNYNKSSLMELGMISFFRDIGLTLLSHLIEQPRRLKGREYEEVQKHPLYTERLLEGLGLRNELFKQVILQHHEREDGSGYPNRLKGGDIHEYAKIIAIAEVYESLTHNRPIRAGLAPHTAMREIVEEGVGFFGHRVTKAFIKEFGVYPVGSTVELNTGETAKVIAVHKDFPLRPVVQVVLDSEAKPTSRVLDLLEKPQVFIKRPI
jgi:HD-GYP domain-containing protein (c-di-GMP phosphodiesterase class II)